MRKVLWFSRHAMTTAQKADLEKALGAPLQIAQINGTAANVHVPFQSAAPETGETVADIILTGEQKPLKELVKEFDEVAAVLPLNILSQLLPFCPAGRVLQAKNKRILLEDGKVEFCHDGWQGVLEVKIVTEDL